MAWVHKDVVSDLGLSVLILGIWRFAKLARLGRHDTKTEEYFGLFCSGYIWYYRILCGQHDVEPLFYLLSLQRLPSSLFCRTGSCIASLRVVMMEKETRMNSVKTVMERVHSSAPVVQKILPFCGPRYSQCVSVYMTSSRISRILILICPHHRSRM